MTLDEALWQNPERCSGAVCFRGTRVMVSILFDNIGEEGGLESFMENFPDVSIEQVRAVLNFSRESVEDRFIPRLAA